MRLTQYSQNNSIDAILDLIEMLALCLHDAVDFAPVQLFFKRFVK